VRGDPLAYVFTFFMATTGCKWQTLDIRGKLWTYIISSVSGRTWCLLDICGNLWTYVTPSKGPPLTPLTITPFVNSYIQCLWVRWIVPNVCHGRMARGGHGLHEVLLGSAMPDPSKPCGLPAGWVACNHLLPLWPPHTAWAYCMTIDLGPEVGRVVVV
jgi:hypothetical protein